MQHTWSRSGGECEGERECDEEAEAEEEDDEAALLAKASTAQATVIVQFE